MKEYYEYYYNLSIAYFVSDAKSMFMDKNEYTLLHPAKAAGDDILVSLDDLARIYGPYMETSAVDKMVHIELKDDAVDLVIGTDEMAVGGEIVNLTAPVCMEDGVIYVPVAALMGQGFDKYIASSKGMAMQAGPLQAALPEGQFVIAICDKFEYKEVPGKYVVEAVPREKFEFEPEMLSWIARVQSGVKNYGELLRSFWFEKAGKVQTYSIYVPVTYDPAVPSKMVVALHGGGLGEQAIYSLSHNKVQLYSEKYNYIFVAPNACTKNSSYGNIMEGGRFNAPGVAPDFSCVDNPYHMPEETVARMRLGEFSVLETIEDVCSHYNIDRKHIYLQGNSMGGMGTFFLGSRYPEIFRAIAPFGAGVTLDLIPEGYKGLAKTPIRMVGGTEDPGFPRIKATYEKFKAEGFDIELAVVGGGVHYDSWAYVLEETYQFYEKNA